jgi:hypothetical protein
LQTDINDTHAIVGKSELQGLEEVLVILVSTTSIALHTPNSDGFLPSAEPTSCTRVIGKREDRDEGKKSSHRSLTCQLTDEDEAGTYFNDEQPSPGFVAKSAIEALLNTGCNKTRECTGQERSTVELECQMVESRSKGQDVRRRF